MRRPRIAFSGRIEGSTLSHLGPPTAPSNTASAALQASIVSSVKGTPYASIDAPPAFLSIQLTFTLAFSKATSHTAFAAAIISVPIPSPGINTIFFSLIYIFLSDDEAPLQASIALTGRGHRPRPSKSRLRRGFIVYLYPYVHHCEKNRNDKLRRAEVHALTRL